jgi:hypothetical protein
MTDHVRDLAALLTPEELSPGLSLRPADVVSIAPDGFPRIKIGNSSTIIPSATSSTGVFSLRRCAVGERVWVFENGTDRIVLGGSTYPAELWMPAREFDASLGAPTYASFGAWATNQWGWHFPNGTDSGVIGHKYLPSDYVPGSTITGDILFTCASGGNVKVDSQFAAIRPGTDAMNTTGAIPPGSSNIVAPTGLEQLITGGCGTASGTPAPGCLLNIAVDRNGGSGSDTNAAIITFHGVRFRYTAYRP